MTKDFIKKIADIFGDQVFLDDSTTDYIPVGSVSLESAIGAGGLPRGRFSEIYGPEGSAKTSLALNFAKHNSVNLGGKTLYIDVENLLDYASANAMAGHSFSRDELLILQPDTAEDAFTIAEEGIISGDFSYIVLDSVGALAPKKEKDDDFSDANVALVPRLLSKFLRRNAHQVKTNNVAFLFINQVRDTVGSYMSSYSTPGGHALKHYTSLIVSLTKGTPIKQGTDIIGTNIQFNIRKNKLNVPFRSYTIPLIFGKGIDTARDLVNFAITCGVVMQSGSSYKFNGESLGKGMNGVITNLNSNPALFKAIADALKKDLTDINGLDSPIEGDEIEQ